MTSPVDIRPDHLVIVQDILRKHLPAGVRVWVFGSRANWNTKDSSDLDLALQGDNALSHKLLGVLQDAFEDSPLPYTVDVVDLRRISESFRRIVESERTPLSVEGAANGAAYLAGNNGQWRTVKLGDVCTKIGSGATPRGGKDVYLQDGPYALIRSQNVYNDGFHREGLAFVGEHHANELRNVEVSEGDVLLNITGDSVARVCQVVPDVLPARVNQHVAIIRPDSDNLDLGYLRYYLVSPEMQTLLLSWAGSGGTRNALTKAMIESLEIPLPPLSEQRVIAHILGTLDDKIELNRRMNETLEAMARALFKSWFVDFDPVRAKMEGRWHRGESLPGFPADLYDLFPDRLVDSELGEIPEGWEVKALGEVVGLNPREPMKRGALAPYLDMAALPTSGSSPDNAELRGFKSGTRFRNGDTLLARITPCLENGKTAFVQSLATGKVGWGSTEFIVLRAVPPVLPEYTYLLARDATFREHAIQSMTGTSGRQRVQVDALAPYPLPSPPVEVWAEFSALVSPLFAQIEVNRRESLALAAQRDALLPGLVSGKVRADNHNSARRDAVR